jgi:chromosome partitioning protein
MQCDITNALGFQTDLDDVENLDDAIKRLSSVYGLADVASRNVKLEQIIVRTEIPTLSLIPETPELVVLEREISARNMRDFWLRDNIISPLKKNFDLIIIDCSPNWNLLISNALMACDVLISPLECKINNYRNFQAFKVYLDNFKAETKKNFKHIFVPTKFASTRKLSSEIRAWYLANVPGCISCVIRESAPCEEAMASHQSLPEYDPKSMVADEMRETILEIWNRVLHATSSPQKEAPTKETKSLSNSKKKSSNLEL